MSWIKSEPFVSKNKVIIGIRSEDISPSNSNTSDEFWYFEKNVDLTEPLGTETQLFIKLKNKEIINSIAKINKPRGRLQEIGKL